MTFQLITSCTSQDWIVGNLPLTPQDSVLNEVFTEVMDRDSITHWYYGYISDYNNWCYKHTMWETIKPFNEL